LNITCPIDAGIGGIQVAYGSSTTLTNRTDCTSSIAYTLTNTQGPQTVYMQFRDEIGNTGNIINDTINYDTTGATLTFTGNTPANNARSSGTFLTGQIDI
jgi:hypothetical protein